MISGKRNIKDGSKYNKFFPKADGTDRVVNKNALLSDTIIEMRGVINETLWHTKAIAKHLKADSVRKTCQNIWMFCYHHIQYKQDERGTEQIRSPRRSWHDRESGIDCDCFTVLIGSILTNLKIPFVMRLWRNSEPHFEHVYPVAFTPKGKEVVIDCVIDQFDEQAPYTEIKDIEMELQVLDGVDKERYNEFGDKVFFETDLPIDAEDLGLSEDVMDLEGVDGIRDWMKRQKQKSQQRKAQRKQKRAQKKTVPLKERVRQKVKNFGKKLNKVNPVTSLMRAGILASMKLNILGVASKLRFAYWTPQQARRANMNMAKYSQIQQLRTKIEGIYRKLGGDIKSLRKTVLTGKGNRNQMVALSGVGRGSNGWGTITLENDLHSLRAVLGEEVIADDLYDSGILEPGINGLGSVTLTAAIAAAAGFIAKLAGMIKKIGGIFNRGSKQEAQLQIQQNTEAQEEKTSPYSAKRLLEMSQRTRAAQQILPNSGSNTNVNLPSGQESEMYDLTSYDPADEYYNSGMSDGGSSQRNTGDGLPDSVEPDPTYIDTTDFEPSDTGSNENAKDGSDEQKPWYKNPWLIGGAAAVGLGIAGYFILKPKDTKSVNGVSGVSKPKKKTRVKKKSARKVRKPASRTRKKKPTRKPTKTRKRTIRRVQLKA